MLNGTPVLVAEDEIFIALDLAFAVEDAGGVVVGPAASVAEALDLLATKAVGAAILDVNLTDGDCSAVVEILGQRRTPTIIQTGLEAPPGLLARFPDLIVYTKPCLARRLVAQLETMLDAGGGLVAAADLP